MALLVYCSWRHWNLFSVIKDINEETWRKFVAYCKLKGVTVAEELDEILKNHLKKELKRLFEGNSK